MKEEININTSVPELSQGGNYYVHDDAYRWLNSKLNIDYDNIKNNTPYKERSINNKFQGNILNPDN